VSPGMVLRSTRNTVELNALALGTGNGREETGAQPQGVMTHVVYTRCVYSERAVTVL